jgi:hypothetical protein
MGCDGVLVAVGVCESSTHDESSSGVVTLVSHYCLSHTVVFSVQNYF